MSKTCKEYFGERLRSLRCEKGLSQDALSKDLGISKGALCYYENCDRTPDIAILDKVAKYFNVSLDYLMGYTENKTTDVNLKNMCEYTGLSEEAIKLLNLDIVKMGDYFFNEQNIEDDEKELFALRKEISNAIIQSGFYFDIVKSMADLETFSKQYLSLKEKTGSLTVEDMSKIAEKLEIDFVIFVNLVCSKNKNKKIKKKPRYNYDELEENCDLCRYSLIKLSEQISEMCDYRYEYLNYSRSDLLKFVNITEEDIKNAKKGGDPNAHNNPPQE